MQFELKFNKCLVKTVSTYYKHLWYDEVLWAKNNRDDLRLLADDILKEVDGEMR